MTFLRKIEQLLFYLLLFSIPFQTRKILWQQSWYFNEWQAISIYATDVLLIVLLLFWALNHIKSSQFSIFPPALLRNAKRAGSFQFQNPNFYLIIFLVISAISIKNSSNFTLSIYSFLKLVEFVIFYFYIKSYAIDNFGFIPSLVAIISGAVFQSVIAVAQFWKQSGLGLRIFGESLISRDLTGIASFYNLYGERVIRAYGTTPHPNILAAYLFLAVFAFYFIWLYKGMNKLYLFVYGLILLAFFFTFARVMIFLLFLNFLIKALLIRLKFKSEFCPPSAEPGRGRGNKKLVPIVLATLIGIVVLCVFYWPDIASRIKISAGEEAVQMRIFYGMESLKSGIHWFGIGPGNFVNRLMVQNPNISRHLYQPVHNIYLLLYSETGALGISTFLLFLIFLAKDFISRTHMEKLYHYSFFLIFLSVLFMGLFDHFLLTLQQGRFIFWLAIALLTQPLKGNAIF